MRPIRWVALGALLALASCDVGTVAVMLSKGKGGGGGDNAPVVVVSPGPEFRTWVAWTPDAAAADSARAALVAANGNPAGTIWTPVDTGTATTEFDPAADPASINTILTQVNVIQNYRLDSIEILDGQNRVVEHASGTVWSNLVASTNEILGTPDGAGAVTAAVDGVNAFIFTRFSGPIDRFRVNATAENALPAPGDVMAVGGYSSNDIERPGGLVIDPNGLIHLTLTVRDTVRLVRYSLDGAYVDGVQIDGGIKTSVGSHSVALNSSGEIFTASTIYDGKVLVQQNHPDLSKGWNRTFASGKHSDRVEANGIAVDESGDVVIAGAMNSALGLNHWLAKVDGGNGSVIFSYQPGGDPGETYWHGVAAGPGNQIYTTGDQTSGLLGVVQILTGRFSPAGAGQWEDSFGDSDAPDDVGQAIALDSAWNILMGGFMGTTTEGRNAVLVRYGAAGTLSQVTTYNGLANGDDEILDLAVDTDGSIYAVGYETVSGQGQNWWVRKYDANFTPVWTRTHDGGFGDDRAISVAIHGDQLVVAGFQTVAGGQTKFVLRVYAK
jgi:hypothetical protein